ncbi:unnamed protein product [Amoebophrya sp. A120]|nr:unnamed protein product [Amoebophrya sp. A120]|eukprot:GSA120T00015021001.1
MQGTRFSFGILFLDRKDGITADDLYEGLMTKVVGHDSKYCFSFRFVAFTLTRTTLDYITVDVALKKN